jgi:bifunctional oligoribonuclease and PAP phosphatase NrnA
MIDAREYHSVRHWLENCRRPLIVTHRRPDGDALGAMAAMTLALRAAGQAPIPALYESLPQRYEMLRQLVDWVSWDAARAAPGFTCDAVVIVDTCANSQLEPLAAFLPTAPRILVIDHHPTRDPIGTRAGDLRLIDETASAASLLVGEWIQAIGLPLSPATATALFVGLATDCGWFRFSNTDARTLRMAATLIDAGAPSTALYRAIYEQDTPAKLRLIARLLGSLQMFAEERLAVLTLRPADFAATGAARDMTEDVVNEASRLGCTEATILFTEETDGTVRVNFRSKQSLDVAKLASQFGGGGHARAAGARLKEPFDTAVQRVIAAAIQALGT